MKSYLKIFAWTIFLALISLCTFLLIISYPQAYYFNDSLTYKNFHVYYDKKIPNQAHAILDSIDQSIRQSELYDPTLQFKIFLRSEANKYNFFSLQFPDDCMGWAIPVIKNVFLHKSDVMSNTSYNHLGHARALSSVLAHELTHIMVDNKFPIKSKIAWFDPTSLSEFGALWKEEGYAEYIAGGASIELDEGLKILNGEAVAKSIPYLEYFKYWLSVRHLILRKQMTFEEILNAKLNLNEVLEEAIRNVDIYEIISQADKAAKINNVVLCESNTFRKILVPELVRSSRNDIPKIKISIATERKNQNQTWEPVENIPATKLKVNESQAVQLDSETTAKLLESLLQMEEIANQGFVYGTKRFAIISLNEPFRFVLLQLLIINFGNTQNFKFAENA